jgi:soluble lytic murein transglycosylase-like protein
MSEVQGDTYPEWSSFVAEVTAELSDGPLAPAARPRRRAAPALRALSLAVALAAPATLGPADPGALAGLAPSPPVVTAAPGAARDGTDEGLGLELLGVVPTPRDGWVERVAARFEQRLVGLDELEQRELARTLVDEAERARVDPLLVLALIQVESAYDPTARSDRGALGLMQLLEPTLRSEARRAGEARADPLDPETNVRMGIRYLRRLLDVFGKRDLALMAYNAGPNRILGHLRGGGIPERFHEYPRRVRAELRRLRQAQPERKPGPARGGRAGSAQARASQGRTWPDTGQTTPRGQAAFSSTPPTQESFM